jgi:hypothetical protein
VEARLFDALPRRLGSLRYANHKYPGLFIEGQKGGLPKYRVDLSKAPPSERKNLEQDWMYFQDVIEGRCAQACASYTKRRYTHDEQCAFLDILYEPGLVRFQPGFRPVGMPTWSR